MSKESQTMEVQLRGATLIAENICYTVREGRVRKTKVILNNVSFIAEAGSLTAIMGPSGK